MRRLLRSIGVVALATLSSLVQAQDDASLEQLARIRAAAEHLTYSGVFVYQQGGEVRSSRITHTHDNAGALEKLQMLDGQPREFLRRADEVRALMPEVRTVMVERTGTRDSAFPAVLQSDPKALLQHYRLKRISAERVAELETDALVLEPMDGLRYGYRLFADKRSGLLLKAQTVNERGDVVEQMAFTEVRIGGTVAKSAFDSSWNTRDWKVEQAGARTVDLNAWQVTKPVPGFERITNVKRSLAGHGEVSQIVFSDGMAAVSIFIEARADSPASHEAAHHETISSEGSVNVLSKQHGAYWITVLGEAPAAAIRQFADTLELKSTTP